MAIGGATINLFNDAERLVAEYDIAGTTVLRKYVHGPGMDEPSVWYEGAGTTAKNWLYADHLGSVVATANGTGASTATYSYGPYGEPNVATGLRFRYTGQQLIGELGLYYYKARFYSPAVGRFLQTDPIGYRDDQNVYAYAGNNATNKIDPSGRTAVAIGGQTHYVTAYGGLASPTTQSSASGIPLSPLETDAPQIYPTASYGIGGTAVFSPIAIPSGGVSASVVIALSPRTGQVAIQTAVNGIIGAGIFGSVGTQIGAGANAGPLTNGRLLRISRRRSGRR